MSITTSNSNAAEVAARDAGVPSFLGLNILDDRATSAGKWIHGNSLPVWADADVADANYPTRRAHDRNPWTVTRPNADISSSRYVSLLFHLTPGADAAHTLDTVSHQILNGDALPSHTLRIRIASLANFSDMIEVKSFGTANTIQKHVSALLGDGDDQYIGIEYIAFILDAGAGNTFTSIIPQLGHAAAGKRRQAGHNPRESGYDEAPLASETEPFVAGSGAAIEWVLRSGQAIIPATWQVTPAGVSGIDEVTMMRNFFADTAYGTKHFLYVDEPVRSPIARAHWMRFPNPNQRLPLRKGPYSRDWKFVMEELPPFQTVEV